MAKDQNEEKEQQASDGYDYQKEVQSIEDRYGKAEQSVADTYTRQEEAIAGAYDTQIGGYDTFLSEVGKKQEELGIKSEEQEKRANAYRYIAGIGDAISGVANLVGTAHGAANQEQYYNAPEIIQKAEASRAERKLEMEKLNERMDELRAQKSVLESTKGMKLGELEGKKASELLGLELQKGRDLAAAGQMAREEGWRKTQHEEGKRQFDETKSLQREQMEQSQSQFEAQEARLERQHAEDVAAKKEIAQAKIEQAKQKAQSDPKIQSSVLKRNVVGVRDELAQKMGYKDYNEFLQYQNVSGVGEDIKGMRNKEAKKIRGERESANPEVVQFLDVLGDPESLTDTQLMSLVGASKVFADAMDKVAIDPANDDNL